MITIDPKSSAFHVMVHFHCQPKDQDQIVEMAKMSLPIFSKQHGFISTTTFRSLDGTEVTCYTQWESQADHEACMRSPDFKDGEQFFKWLAQNQIRMDVKPYTIIFAAEA